MAKRELKENWTFEPSRPSLRRRLVRLYTRLLRARPAPPRRMLLSVTARPRWICYFLYLPDGRLRPSHLYALEQFRRTDAGLLAVCATPSPDTIPDALPGLVDALCWKGLSGFDFSAYSIALDEVAAKSPGADLLMLNDSVLGPLASLDPFFARARWDVTGFTASSMVENHLQSYAMLVRDVTPARVRILRRAIPRRIALDGWRDIVQYLETRLARILAPHLSVGAFWYAGGEEGWDPTLSGAVELLDAGFPFIKNALFGKAAGRSDQAALRAWLERAGHPPP